ncbi:MAG: family 16 glycoside hydrolase [Bacteroidota bacterium]
MTDLSFEDLSAFRSTSSNWKIVGSVRAPMGKSKTLETTKGAGILVNLPDDKNKAQIFTQFEHGDIDLDFEVMMPAGSNSGVYLQGRYEIQLLDSWGKKRPSFSDLGGIYQRWDDTQPKGQKGFEGTAPLANAAKAPGLWQRMKISFQAPRFDAQGQKIQNARIIYVELNGVTIHRNVELTGPTRGPYVGNGKEAAMGPIVIQGDHGPVAFRNFKYRNFDGQAVQIKDLKYRVVRGLSDKNLSDWSKVTAEMQGEDELMNWNVAKTDNDFAILYDGQLEVPATKDYFLKITYQGRVRLWIDNEMILDETRYNSAKKINLTKGRVPIRFEYRKTESWQQPQLGFSVEGNDFRPADLHYKNSSLTSNPTDPIYEHVDGQTRLLRSFVDFQLPDMEKPKRFTNTINVGDPTGVHYTYDLNQGSLVQIWRGNFLNMTPMWYNRGNGVSVARGVLVPLTPNAQIMQRQADGSMAQSFAESQYQYRSYTVDEDNRPTFHYRAYGVEVADQLIPSADRKSIQRKLNLQSKAATDDLVFCIAEGKKLAKIDQEYYLVDDQYYIKTTADAKIEKHANDRSALVVPIKGEQKELAYTIVW